MARKKKHPEHVNHERWLVSYADFITLLFAFFTTLYAISTVDAKKAGKMVYSMQQAFNVDFFPSKDAVLGGTPSTEGVGGKGAGGSKTSLQVVSSLVPKTASGGGSGEGGDGDLGAHQRMRALARQVVEVIQARGLAGKVDVKIEPQRGLVISLAEAAFFDSGAAELKAGAVGAMEAIAEILRRAPQQVRVEGHTDDRPIRTARFPSNWELSAARAVFIVEVLVQEYGLSPDQLSAAGYASFRPVDTNETSEGRARNRRVDIVLLHEEAARSEPGAAPAGQRPRSAFLPQLEADPAGDAEADAPPMTPAVRPVPALH
jgi:chemotaxis protein MotB